MCYLSRLLVPSQTWHSLSLPIRSPFTSHYTTYPHISPRTGGIAPHRVLPITLDVGTNNPELLADPSYVGIQKNRLVGEEYFDFVDEFMQVLNMMVCSVLCAVCMFVCMCVYVCEHDVEPVQSSCSSLP